MKFLQIGFISCLILAVAIRLLLSFLYAPHLKSGQYINFQTVLLTEPTSHGSFDTMVVQYSNGFSSVPFSLALASGNGLHYGEAITISGKVRFKLLKNGQLITTLSSPRIKIDTTKDNFLLHLSYLIRQRIKSLYANEFSPNLSSLLLGIVLGTKVNFPKTFLTAMQQTGVVHVLAAEGLNVIIFSEFSLGLFLLLFKRQWASVLTIVGLLFYCMLCGFQPSIVRSTIMMSFAVVASLFGRQYSSLYGLLLAGGGMILYNPSWIGDIGFQLSFMATLGIFYLKPLMPDWKIISDDVNTTIAAQVATLPILLGSFGSYGLLSILANAFILWTIPPLMILGAVGGLVGMVFEPIGNILLFLCFPMLFFFEKIIFFFASFPWQLSLPEVPINMIAGYYLILGSIVLFFKKKRNKAESI